MEDPSVVELPTWTDASAGAPPPSSRARRGVAATWATLLVCGAAAAWTLRASAQGSAAPHRALFEALAAAAGGSGDGGSGSGGPVRTIALKKQHVPVHKNNVTVAHKTAYYGSIFVGHPTSQRFTVVFDTGSGHVILPSTTCGSETCRAHRRFDRSLSASAVDIEHDGKPVRSSSQERDHLAITFGTGKVTGEFIDELVCLDGNLEDCTRVHVVLAMDMTPEPFGAFVFDGVLGLGLDRLSLTPRFNFFGQLGAHPDGRLSKQFAVFLSASDDVESEISFGGHNAQRLASPLQWTPVAAAELGYWQIPIKSVRVGSEVLSICDEPAGCRAILDTGTSLLGVPREQLRTVHRHLARVLPEDHPSDIDCRKYPGESLHFELYSGAVIEVGSADYSRMAPASMQVVGQPPDKPRDFCRGALLPVDARAPITAGTFIFGEPVLRRYYTVYDFGARRVGFGLAAQPLQGSSGAEVNAKAVS